MKEIIIKKIKLSGDTLEHHLKVDDNILVVRTTYSSDVLPYIVTDRIDALAMGLILFAVKYGYDFMSHIPISEGLLYNLQNHFLGAITSSGSMHIPSFDCPTIRDIKSSQAIVSTGVSCGIDSLFTILHHTRESIPDDYRLTHLTFMNLGSHHTEGGTNDRLLKGRREHIMKYAASIKLPVLEIGSNLPDIISQIAPRSYSHVNYHTFMSVFAMLNIANGLRQYYYSSGHSYNGFNCNLPKNGEFDSANYDLLTLMTASYGNLRFASFGGGTSRLNKVGYIAEFPEDACYLNVCVSAAHNCGKCFKCQRTLLEIDALHKEKIFSKAFDMQQYTLNKKRFLAETYILYLRKDEFARELIPYFNLSTIAKFKALMTKFLSAIKNRLR